MKVLQHFIRTFHQAVSGEFFFTQKADVIGLYTVYIIQANSLIPIFFENRNVIDASAFFVFAA